jgi:hypothetical protein
MTRAHFAGRIALVLGRRPTVDLPEVFARARQAQTDMIILAVGFPLSARQQEIVDEAIALAVDTEVWLEARIAYRAREVSSWVQRTDEVVLSATGWERRRIGWALRRAGLAPAPRPQPAAR